MRKLLLALPLASVLLLAGCDCNTCTIPADDCNTCPVAPAAVEAVYAAPAAPARDWEYVTASAGKAASGAVQMTAEEYQALLASGKVREVGSESKAAPVEVAAAKPRIKAPAVVEVVETVSAAPLIADAGVREEVDVVPAAPAFKTVAVKAEEPVVESSVPRIPSMPLPEGWNYIDEKDLTGGSLNTVAVDQYYTRVAKSSPDKDI